jgi:hypothetical protein
MAQASEVVTVADPTAAWTLTEHCCRVCFGRVLKRIAEDGQPIVLCCDCGAAAEGDHDALCACGAELGPAKVRLQCQRQAEPTPEAPCEIVAVEVSQ